MSIVFETYDITAIPVLMNLFYETIRTININDYSQEQIEAWAPDDIDIERWQDRIAKNYCLLAKTNQEVGGFAEISPDGYIDMLFVHKNQQGKQIGKQLVEKLETYAREQSINRVTTETSITAKPFFEHLGYQMISEQNVEIKNVELKNFLMEKFL